MCFRCTQWYLHDYLAACSSAHGKAFPDHPIQVHQFCLFLLFQKAVYFFSWKCASTYKFVYLKLPTRTDISSHCVPVHSVHALISEDETRSLNLFEQLLGKDPNQSIPVHLGNARWRLQGNTSSQSVPSNNYCSVLLCLSICTTENLTYTFQRANQVRFYVFGSLWMCFPIKSNLSLYCTHRPGGHA